MAEPTISSGHSQADLEQVAERILAADNPFKIYTQHLDACYQDALNRQSPNRARNTRTGSAAKKRQDEDIALLSLLVTKVHRGTHAPDPEQFSAQNTDIFGSIERESERESLQKFLHQAHDLLWKRSLLRKAWELFLRSLNWQCDNINSSLGREEYLMRGSSWENQVLAFVYAQFSLQSRMYGENVGELCDLLLPHWDAERVREEFESLNRILQSDSFVEDAARYALHAINLVDISEPASLTRACRSRFSIGNIRKLLRETVKNTKLRAKQKLLQAEFRRLIDSDGGIPASGRYPKHSFAFVQPAA